MIVKPTQVLAYVEGADEKQAQPATVDLRLEEVYVLEGLSFALLEDVSLTVQEILRHFPETLKLSPIPCRVFRAGRDVFCISVPSPRGGYTYYVVVPRDLSFLRKIYDELASHYVPEANTLRANIEFFFTVRPLLVTLKDVLRKIAELYDKYDEFRRAVEDVVKVEEKELYLLERQGVYVFKLQKVKMPGDKVGLLFHRSSLQRAGLIPLQTVVDPGFEGHIYTTVIKPHTIPIFIEKRARVVQMLVLEVGEVAKVYEGQYKHT